LGLICIKNDSVDYGVKESFEAQILIRKAKRRVSLLNFLCKF